MRFYWTMHDCKSDCVIAIFDRTDGKKVLIYKRVVRTGLDFVNIEKI